MDRLKLCQQLWLWPVTAGLPTNFCMLCFRTAARELGLPWGHRAIHDPLAQELRRKLMPLRSAFFHSYCTWLLRSHRLLFQSRVFGCPGIMDFVAVRAMWLDELTLHAIASGVTQVVTVAAGFCTRAQRIASVLPSGLHLPTFFEIDLPHASARKRQLMADLGKSATHNTTGTTPCGPAATSTPAATAAAARPRTAYIAADLSKVSLVTALLSQGHSGRSDAVDMHLDLPPVCASKGQPGRAGTVSASGSCLPPNNPATSGHSTTGSTPHEDAGQGGEETGCPYFFPSERTLFLVEGLTYYLPGPAVQQLLASVGQLSAAGSIMAFDLLDQDVWSRKVWARGYNTFRLTVQNKGEKLLSGLPSSQSALSAAVAPHGFDLQALYNNADLAHLVMSQPVRGPAAGSGTAAPVVDATACTKPSHVQMGGLSPTAQVQVVAGSAVVEMGTPGIQDVTNPLRANAGGCLGMCAAPELSMPSFFHYVQLVKRAAV